MTETVPPWYRTDPTYDLARRQELPGLIDRGAAAIMADLLADRGPLYVSIDLDVLDLGLVAGTTLPEPGGLSYRQLRSVLAEVARRGRGVAFDIRAQPTVRPVLLDSTARDLDDHPFPQRDLRPPVNRTTPTSA